MCCNTRHCTFQQPQQILFCLDLLRHVTGILSPQQAQFVIDVLPGLIRSQTEPVVYSVIGDVQRIVLVCFGPTYVFTKVAFHDQRIDDADK